MYGLTRVALLATGVLSLDLRQRPLLGSSIHGSVAHGEKPLVTSEGLQGDISKDALLARAKHLYEIAELSLDEYNHPTRVIGSKGHVGTIEYIYEQISSLGDYYTLSNQSFPAVMGKVYEYQLILANAVPPSARAMSLTPPTPGKQAVTGPLVAAANSGCHAADYPADTADAVAFVRRGECSFGDKSAAAGRAGARAAVVYNNVPGDLSGTLGDPSADHVPTFGLSLEDALPVLEELGEGNGVDASAYIDAVVSKVLTTNVIAQTKGGDPENCVMLGGHSDSVAAGPGINDDGSGTVTLLEVAARLVQYEVKNCVRFAWWAGEEEGLLGSDYYVAQLNEAENRQIRLFMDYDMLASPNYAYQVYDAHDAVDPVGSEFLRDMYVAWYKAQGLNYTFIPFDGRSDYVGFIRHGIPGGGVATGAEGVKSTRESEMFGGTAGEWYDHCYHQLCDDVSNLALEAWEVNTKLVAHSVAMFAASFDGFPERLSLTSNSAPQRFSYHGNKLII